MVNPSTANALKDRAQRASISLKQWAKRLETQLNEQRLPPDAWRKDDGCLNRRIAGKRFRKFAI
jgi:hypothetical protein